MRRPSFFAQLPRPRVRDPHADLLGASDEGHLESGYADAAKRAGHSWPTLATAYILGHAP
jgi:hypothetical protein